LAWRIVGKDGQGERRGDETREEDEKDS